VAADLWLSIGLGSGLGLLYGSVAYLFHRKALNASRKQFLKLVFGGLVIRMFVALAVVLAVLVAVPVREGAFTGSFLIVFVVTTIIEIHLLDRGRRASKEVVE
jgi:hypothetical protein